MSFNRRHLGITAALALAAVILLPAMAGSALWTLLSNRGFNVNRELADVTVADFDNDGNNDILSVIHRTNGSFTLNKGIGTAVFEKRLVRSLDHDPVAVRSADFNNDGNADIVMANWDDNTISVLLGAGDGKFSDPADYPADLGTVDLAVADFNSDGVPDIAAANVDAADISVYLGDGDGTFQPPLYSPAGNTPRKLVAADFNSDGRQDIACTNWDDNTVSVLLGDGDGSFQAPAVLAAGAKPWALDAADFDSDGDIDIASTNAADNTMMVFLGNGDGTFQDAVSYGADDGPSAIRAAHINRDGVIDLAVTNALGNTMYVYAGKGDGSFSPIASFYTSIYPVALAVADLDNDHLNDLVVGNFTTGIIIVYKGAVRIEGDFRFQNITSASSYEAGLTPAYLFTGDYNDGFDPDIIAADASDRNLLPGDGAGAFGAYTSYAKALRTPTCSPTVDLNADRLTDFATMANYSAVSVQLALPGGGLDSPSYYRAGRGGTCVRAADFNGDGYFDLAVANPDDTEVFSNITGGTVAVLMNLHDGTFQEPITTFAGPKPDNLITPDMNNDGYPDLVVSSQDTLIPSGGTEPVYVITVLMNNLNGTFGPGAATIARPSPGRVIAANLTNDRYPDLIVLNGGGVEPEGGGDLLYSITVMINTTGSGFTSVTHYDVMKSPPTDVVVCDLNRDSPRDLLVPCGGDDKLYMFYNNGSGLFTTIGGQDTLDDPSVAEVGDFNIDGLADIVVGYAASTDLTVMLGIEKSVLAANVATAGVADDTTGGNIEILKGADVVTNGEYDTRTVFTITATPAPGYAFTGWTGDYSGRTNPLEVVLAGDKTLTANFDIGPYVSTIDPTSGIMNDLVTVDGMNFGSKGNVRMGGKKVKTLTWSDTEITFLVPAKMPFGDKTIDITSSDNGRTGSVGFTVRQAEITGLSASSGPAGSALTISGADFGTGKVKVYFYPKDGSKKKSAKPAVYSNTSIDLVLPRKMNPGDYDVVVKNSHGESKVADPAINDFTVTP